MDLTRGFVQQGNRPPRGLMKDNHCFLTSKNKNDEIVLMMNLRKHARILVYLDDKCVKCMSDNKMK